MSHNDKLEHMREEYYALPVPKSAKARIEDGMRRAYAEKKLQRRRVWHRGITTAAAAVIICFVMGCNLNASVAYAMREIPILGDFARVVTFRTYENHIGDMEAKVNVPFVEDKNPTLSNAVDSLNKTVEEYIGQIVEQFEKDVKALGEDGRMDLITDYEVVTNTDQWFSLRINTDMVMNGSTRNVKIYHIDKTTGKMAALKDLFRENSDFQSQLAKALLTEMERLEKEDPEMSFFIGEDVYLGKDVLTSVPNDQSFYINEERKLVLVFDKYAVAPGAMGVVEVEIPTEAIADIVKDGYLK